MSQAVVARPAPAGPAHRLARRTLYILGHPQSLESLPGRTLAVLLTMSMLGGVLIGEVGTPQNVTFGGFSLLAVLAAAWLLPVRLYLPIMAVALVIVPVAAALGGVDDLTAKFQFSATVVACVLAVLTVRALKATEAERNRSHDSLMRFTADAAHELRSPLTLMRSTLEHLLRQPRSTAEYEARTRVVLCEVERLIGVSNALLMLAQSDAGLLATNAGPVHLADLTAELIARWEPAVAAAGIELSSHCPDGAVVACDPNMIGRVLDNLVENAIHHTPRGGQIRVSAQPAAPGWDLAVADTGTGIPAGFRDHLFERFSRGGDGRVSGGTGLGLAVSAAIATAHGGSLALAETGATGTTIVLHLPVTRGSA